MTGDTLGFVGGFSLQEANGVLSQAEEEDSWCGEGGAEGSGYVLNPVQPFFYVPLQRRGLSLCTAQHPRYFERHQDSKLSLFLGVTFWIWDDVKVAGPPARGHGW